MAQRSVGDGCRSASRRRGIRRRDRRAVRSRRDRRRFGHDMPRLEGWHRHCVATRRWSRARRAGDDQLRCARAAVRQRLACRSAVRRARSQRRTRGARGELHRGDRHRRADPSRAMRARRPTCRSRPGAHRLGGDPRQWRDLPGVQHHLPLRARWPRPGRVTTCCRTATSTALFEAAVDATEEAVLDSLFRATTTTGRSVVSPRRCRSTKCWN